MRLILLFILLIFTCPVFAQNAAELNRSGVEKVRQGKYAEALDDFNKALTLADVNAARVYHNIGISYEKQGNYKKAAENYDEAILRNPDQVQSYVRGGYSHFESENFTRAKELGKKGLELDPDNREIPQWLSKAYDKSQKQEKEELFPSTGKLEYGPENTFLIRFETGIIAALLIDPTSFALKGEEGYIIDMPYELYLEYNFHENWGARITAGNPYYGALISHTLSLHERIEGYYIGKNYYVGLGLLGTNYEGKNYFGKTKNLMDIKLGGVYGFKGKLNKLDLYFYPRIIPSDSGYGEDYTFDSSLFDIQWVRAFNRGFDLYSAFSIHEFYYFNNKKFTSDYEGTYDLSGGVVFDNRYNSPFKVYLYLTQRMYMKNYNNPKPYDTFNGQGVFGLDTGNWFTGDPFSGINSFSQILNAKMEHYINKNFLVYERVGIEFTGLEGRRHDFTVFIGLQGGF
jgi:tetratricopeptide (TPR) repeat protein